MPLFAYSAIDSNGKKRKGTLEADTDRDAKEMLRFQGLQVAFLAESVKSLGRKNLRQEALLNFTLQLSQLVGGGIPLYESLSALETEWRGESCHRVILSLGEQIKAGKSLSQAMKLYPESFDKQYRAMIAAGESVGALEVVLERLTKLLKKQSDLKKKVTMALIYPAILSLFSLAVLSLLLGFVVPSIEGIFEGRKLNGYTQAVLFMSHFMRDFWLVVLVMSGAIAAYLYYFFKRPQSKIALQRFLLKLPLIGTLMIQAAVARFTRTMGTLLQGGLPIIDSLRIAREVMQNAPLEEEVLRAEKRIIEGSSLSHELQGARYFPRLAQRMIAVGEEAGTTGPMLEKIAEIYENDVEKSIDTLMTLSQPAILILMGGLIGLILLAVMLPLTDIQAFTQ